MSLAHGVGLILRTMRILLTNDDGILAPGLAALYDAACEFGEVVVAAPETPQSAMGHAITISTPMTARRVHVHDKFHGWSIDGRPADCVKLAMRELLDERPDLVLSGVNAGSNTGVNVIYSGTVAGAVEGAFFGLPAIAFSQRLSKEMDFGKSSAVVRALLKVLLDDLAALDGLCLNVNIPALDAGLPRGVHVCPQALLPMQEKYRYDRRADGERLYWLDGYEPDATECPETDHCAMLDGFVSVTPLRFDMTHHEQLGALGARAWPASFGPQPRESRADA